MNARSAVCAGGERGREVGDAGEVDANVERLDLGGRPAGQPGWQRDGSGRGGFLRDTLQPAAVALPPGLVSWRHVVVAVPQPSSTVDEFPDDAIGYRPAPADRGGAGPRRSERRSDGVGERGRPPADELLQVIDGHEQRAPGQAAVGVGEGGGVRLGQAGRD